MKQNQFKFLRSGLLFITLLCAAFSESTLAQTHFSAASPQDQVFGYNIVYKMKSPMDAIPLATWLREHEFDIAGMNWRQNQIEVITNEDGVNFLQKNGIFGYFSKTASFLAPDDRYLRAKTVGEKLEALAKKYPKLTSLVKAGTSLEGRPIWAMMISTTPDLTSKEALAKPTLILDGMHHAREIMTPEIVMDFAETFLGLATTAGTVEEGQLARWNFWVLPMLNVDGNEIVYTKNALWRKNARGGYGVDINRNYPYKWGVCKGSSSSQSAQDYRGASEMSEPETEALVSLAKKIVPTASLSYHSYSELVLYPYGCDKNLSPENKFIEKFAKALAAKLPSDSGSEYYTPGAPWQILYGVDGDSMDFMHSQFGALAFTFEVNQAFQPAYSLRYPTLKKHRVALKYFLNEIDHDLLTVNVVNRDTQKPLVVEIQINTIQHTNVEKPFKTNVEGNFFKILDQGKYVVKATGADGKSKTAEIEMSGKANAVKIEL